MSETTPPLEPAQPAAPREPMRFGAIKPYYVDPQSGIAVLHADARDVVAEIMGGV